MSDAFSSTSDTSADDWPQERGPKSPPPSTAGARVTTGGSSGTPSPLQAPLSGDATLSPIPRVGDSASFRGLDNINEEDDDSATDDTSFHSSSDGGARNTANANTSGGVGGRVGGHNSTRVSDSGTSAVVDTTTVASVNGSRGTNPPRGGRGRLGVGARDSGGGGGGATNTSASTDNNNTTVNTSAGSHKRRANPTSFMSGRTLSDDSGREWGGGGGGGRDSDHGYGDEGDEVEVSESGDVPGALSNIDVAVSVGDVFSGDVFGSMRDEHTLSVATICDRYDTHGLRGLAAKDHDLRFLAHGPNRAILAHQSEADIKDASVDMLIHKFFGTPARVVLWLTFLLCLIKAGVDLELEYLGLAGMLVVSAFAQTLQFITFTGWRNSASNELRQRELTYMMNNVTVVRNSRRCEAGVESLVAGDVVELKRGERVPADIRIITSSGALVVARHRSGQIVPIQAAPMPSSCKIGEADNIVWCEDVVLEGKALGIVFATGERVKHHNPNWLGADRMLPSDENELSRIALFMRIGAGVMALSFLIAGIAMKANFLEFAILICIFLWLTLPDRLVTALERRELMIAARMCDTCPVVFQTPGVGCAAYPSDVLVSESMLLDESQMRVAFVYGSGRLVEASAAELGEAEFDELLTAMVLSNDKAFFDAAASNDELPMKDRHVSGPPRAAALLKFTERHRPSGLVRLGHSEVWRRETSDGLVVSVHADAENDEDESPDLIVVVSGPLEDLLSLCSDEIVGRSDVELNYGRTEAVRTAAARAARDGCCVRAYGVGYIAPAPVSSFTVDELIDSLSFAGFAALAAPIEQSARHSISSLRGAGINVVLCTSYPLTAASWMAAAVGLIDTPGDSANTLSQGSTVCSCAGGWDDAVVSNADDVPRAFSDMNPAATVELFRFFNSTANSVVAVIGFDDPKYTDVLRLSACSVVSRDAPYASKIEADVLLNAHSLDAFVGVVAQARSLLDDLPMEASARITTLVPATFSFMLYFWFQVPLPITAVLFMLAELFLRVFNVLQPLLLEFEDIEPHTLTPRTELGPYASRTTFSWPFIFYTAVISLFQMMGGVMCYLSVMNTQTHKLAGRATTWGSEITDAFEYDKGGDGTRAQQEAQALIDERELLSQAQAAYFAGLMFVMIAGQHTTRTRLTSLISTVSKPLYAVAVVALQLILMCIVFYFDRLNNVFGTYPVKFKFWLPGIVFSGGIVVLDEVRKYLLRLDPDGFMRYTNYYR